jgi:hypothetical protein
MSEPPSGVRAFDMTLEQEARWEPLFSAARQMLERNETGKALEAARAAWDVLPEPKLECSMAYITILRLVRAVHMAKAHAEGINLLDWAIKNTPFQNNIPVFLVQKGILLFESGQRAAAKVDFGRAWTLAGDFGFRGEDPKYLAFCSGAPGAIGESASD